MVLGWEIAATKVKITATHPFFLHLQICIVPQRASGSEYSVCTVSPYHTAGIFITLDIYFFFTRSSTLLLPSVQLLVVAFPFYQYVLSPPHKMHFGKKPVIEIMEQIIADVDPTEWMLNNTLADFLLMKEAVLYMCLFGYTFLHGCKVFKALPADASVSYKFISMLFACTGGGILVPIFLNVIPVPLANDAYPIAVIISFGLHHYFPVLREVVYMSKIVKLMLIIMYETTRASVVVKLTYAAGGVIAPSLFSFPLFGPIMCGTVGGCGGAFMPLSKGLEPIKGGVVSPMMTAFVGAAMFHLYLNTGLGEGCVDAKAKAHVCMAVFFIFVGVVDALGLAAKKTVVVKAKKE